MNMKMFGVLPLTEQNFLVKENRVIQEIHWLYIAVSEQSPSNELTLDYAPQLFQLFAQYSYVTVNCLNNRSLPTDLGYKFGWIKL